MNPTSLMLAAALAVALGGTAMLTVSGPTDVGDTSSMAAMTAFRQGNPCPTTGSVQGQCPGYVVTHIEPICAEGVDTAENLHWQTRTQAAAMKGWDRQYCDFRRVRLAIGTAPKER